MALACCAGLYTLVMAWDSLSTGLGHDDLMNLTNAWRAGIVTLLRDNLEFWHFGSVHRPFGELFYWVLFRVFYFDPLPYRIACLGLLVFNSALLFWVCRNLDLPPRVGLLTAFLHGYHYGFWALYYNTGTCFDLLAFCFYFLAFVVYIRSRRDDRGRFGAPFKVCALFVVALSSKEIAVTLPALLLAYEALWRPGSPRHAFATLAPTFAAASVYLLGRFGGTGSLDLLPSYKPDWSIAQYWNFLERSFPEILYAYDWPQWLIAASGLLAAIAIVLLFRDRGAALGLALFTVGVAPVAFIDPRSLYASYLPLAGLAMTYAIGIDRTADFIARCTRPTAYAAVVATFCACVLFSHFWVRSHGVADTTMAAQAHEIVAIRKRLGSLVDDPPAGARILLLEDPFLQLEQSWFKGWASVFLVELMYEDVEVDQRFRMHPPPGPESIASYDYVLTSRDARLELVRVQ